MQLCAMMVVAFSFLCAYEMTVLLDETNQEEDSK